ncbi:sigma 54-interacting transcriptional regulator [Holdemanella sp. MSK.7.32]|uniref:sigma 54-interacting transcriptional regulator n=1 Tax=Holdemanella sp. MSK.7.32 TaxID=2965273 RepID=UPI00210BE6A2|nr:sigma 54-interacting transcriptional regulator [Holdemanella sp. MSK.7.32]MCQ4804546.1 sigma 54-interacting transcriptional regulator [Holdemanella sp. MSK.7.32]
MYTKTKQMIFDYLVEETGNLQERNLNVYTANYICEKFIISRSLASHYLNELFKEKELIKVNERPVLYFHRKTIQKNTKNTKLRDEYDSIDDIYKMLHTGVSTFTNVIGSDYSLRNSLVNIKKALHYPDNGLPIVLIGKSGSGRKFISQCVYTYCKSQSLLETNSSYSLIQCGIKNDDMIFQELFSESGILNDDKTGFVVFEDIQNTSFEIQNKLVEYMDIKPKIRWMFLNQNWDEKQLSPSLRSRLLSMISIPSLKERTIHEKELFIIHFVEEQAKKVKEPIWITDYYMEVMIAKEFDNSIENLRNIVIKSFATSYEKKKDKIVLDLSCIPTELKTNVYFYDKEKSCELKDYNSIYHKITIDLF